MKKRPLRVDQALDLLPEMEALIPLRRAFMSASRGDEQGGWGRWSRYRTVDTRVLSAEQLEAQLPELVRREADRARQLYSIFVEVLRETEMGDAPAATAALIRAGEFEEESARFASAESIYERARSLGSGLTDRRPQSLALRRLARVAKSRGKLGRSLELYGNAYELSDLIGDAEGAVVACQGMGNVLVEKGLWKEAEEWYLRGLSLLPTDEPAPALWQLQSNLSLVSRRAGDLTRSSEWLDAAKRTVDELEDAAGRVYVLTAEGLLLLQMGDAEGAEGCYRSALENGRSDFEIARVLVNLGESLVVQGRLQEAEGVYRRLELLALAEGLTASLAYAYRGLGAIATARGDAEGFIFFEQALELCRSGELPDFELALTQLEYAELDVAQRQIESALARLEEAVGCFRRIGTQHELKRAEERLRSLTEEIAPESGLEE